MLNELKDIHDELLGLLNDLAKLTNEVEPDRQRLTGIRWRLSSASGKRRRHLDEIVYPALIARHPGPQGDPVRMLRDATGVAMAATREHVAAWSVDQILVDWAGYREASARMRDTMRLRIAAEQALLYPLLDRRDMAA